MLLFPSQKPLPEHSSRTEPHYRLSLRDVPFVAGTVTGSHVKSSRNSFRVTSRACPLLCSQSAGCSHSVRANVQSVLSLLKRHQPRLCNRRVISGERKSRKPSDAAPPSSGGEGELSELLRALQEEMRLMSL